MTYVSLIRRNAERIREMHALIHTRAKTRDTPGGRAAWEQACSEFHARYDGLAFPGGYQAGLVGIGEGNAEAIEAAIAFLEVRPYFFRSGYMRQTLFGRLKRASLNPAQSERFGRALEAQRQWRAKSLAERAAKKARR